MMDLSVVPYGETPGRARSDVAATGGRYRECMRNHAAAIGGQAYDGCGEFMPAGELGTLEALKCAACGCHRNFHRRDGALDPRPPLLIYGSAAAAWTDAKKPMPLPPPPGFPPFLPPPMPYVQIPPPPPPPPLPSPHQPFDRSRAGSETPPPVDEGGEYADVAARSSAALASAMAMRKRHRTKFTAEQKEKMTAFAEKLGWRIQKHDDVALQEFCGEIGVNRHVLKVWMHNNKSSLSSHSPSPSPSSAGAVAAVKREPAATAAPISV